MDASEPIYCETTHKLLARRDDGGVWLWCKMCKTEHYVPFDRDKTSLLPSLEKNTTSRKSIEGKNGYDIAN